MILSNIISAEFYQLVNQLFQNFHTNCNSYVIFSISLPNQTYADTRCQDITEVVGWKAIWQNLSNMDEQELYEETGCMAKCQRKEWEIRKIFDDKRVANDSLIVIFMFYANGRYQVGNQYRMQAKQDLDSRNGV